MKKTIHPVYVDTLIHCACGNQIATRSTRPDLRIEVCSRCHPFYTGVRQPATAEGRIARFRRRGKPARPAQISPRLANPAICSPARNASA